MASETTYALISSMLNPVREAAFMYAMQNLVMPQVVQTYTDMRGRQGRIFNEYGTGTVSSNVGETTDLDSTRQELTRAVSGTLSPTGDTAATQFLFTDARMESDDVANVMADFGLHINYTVFKKVESDLAALLGSLTGGTIGTAGGTLDWASIYKARAILRNAGVPGPYNVVLHEFQYLRLASAANIAGLTNAAPLTVRNDIQNNYYIGSSGDMNFYTISTAGVSAGTAGTVGIFSRAAIAFDVRRALRIELERNASLRATEANVTMVYACGAVRPTWGVKLIGDASVPT